MQTGLRHIWEWHDSDAYVSGPAERPRLHKLYRELDATALAGYHALQNSLVLPADGYHEASLDMPMLLAGERLRALRFRVLRLPDAERIGECCPIDADPVCVCAAVEPDCVPGPDCYEFFGRHAEAAADICAHVAAVCERIEIYFRETHDVDTGMVGVNAKIEGFQDGILSLVITDIARSIPSCVLLNSRRVDALLPAT